MGLGHVVGHSIDASRGASGGRIVLGAAFYWPVVAIVGQAQDEFGGVVAGLGQVVIDGPGDVSGEAFQGADGAGGGAASPVVVVGHDEHAVHDIRQGVVVPAAAPVHRRHGQGDDRAGEVGVEGVGEVPHESHHIGLLASGHELEVDVHAIRSGLLDRGQEVVDGPLAIGGALQ
ncbi:hypothetical protein ES703_66578 [subsurface metagenome]